MEITDPLLTARESASVLQVSVPTFWRRVADGTVPPPVKIGNLSRWPRSEIAEVIEIAKAQRYAGREAIDTGPRPLSKVLAGAPV